ncbi:hypothetical protein QCE63_17435 [Caballeronia sp. LZ065]|uniref:hypothetical protein n=1 Tax=Caballeronia sp. LZ065 TaxID=3038571 RepID=UPI0028674479|nr:hypothetical protein [Caballeronia sp. LZ065]MDR5781195.1 hypothetical protein [Caballeronia sp. LZ065]
MVRQPVRKTLLYEAIHVAIERGLVSDALERRRIGPRVAVSHMTERVIGVTEAERDDDGIVERRNDENV